MFLSFLTFSKNAFTSVTYATGLITVRVSTFFFLLHLGAGPEAPGPEASGPEASGPETPGPAAPGPEASGPEAPGPEVPGLEVPGSEVSGKLVTWDLLDLSGRLEETLRARD